MGNNAAELAAVRRKFWPRVDAKGGLVKPDSQDCLRRHNHKKELDKCVLSPSGGYSPELRKLGLDPDTVWVGSFLRGLVHFGIMPGYHTAKAFFFDSADANVRIDRATGRTVNVKPRMYRLGFERASKLVGTWPYNGSKYGEKYFLQRISGSGIEGDEDPGKVVNSAVVRVDEQDLWSRTTSVEINPVIALDTRYGLHMLKRGDRFTRVSTNARGDEKVDIFCLRPISEGSSRVPVVDGEQARVV